jgi:predicted nucleic acid-binding Zn ribbon protein
MGVFQYECPQGHVTEKFVPLAKREDVVKCDHCASDARYVVSAVATTFRAHDRKAFKRQGH